MPHGNRIFQNAGETKAWSSLKISYTLQLLIRLDNTNLLSQATSVSIYYTEESAAKSRSPVQHCVGHHISIQYALSS